MDLTQGSWFAISDTVYYATPTGGRGAPLSDTDAAGAISIGSLTVDPRNPKVIYAGTGDSVTGYGRKNNKRLSLYDDPLLSL
jgi:hypothetical protein